MTLCCCLLILLPCICLQVCLLWVLLFFYLNMLTFCRCLVRLMIFFFFSKRTLQNVPLLLTLQVSLSWCLQMGNPDYRQNWVLSDFQGILRTFSCMQFMCCLYWCASTSPGSPSAPVCRLPLGPQRFEDSKDGLYLQEQLGWSFSF